MSKSIDERVVEMRFDNSNFAKNVKDTMNQVSDLNKSLNSIEPGSAEDSLLRIAAAAEGLQKRFSVVGTAIGRIVENITDTIQQKVTSLISYVTNGIKSGGISRAMKLEAAKFQLEGLLTDAEKEAGQLDAIMANVNTGVSDTAYGLDAAASVASQLAATGMRAGEEMEHTLVGISGVAAMTGSTYEEIGHIYTTISGQGKLMGIQLTQLATRGLNAAAILAKSLNITEAEVRELVSDGKISFAQFSEAMYEAFGVHAKAANKTFTGAMSNIRAALAKIGAMFIQPLIANEGPLVDMLNAIRVWLNDLRNYLGPLAKGFQNTIEGIANWVKDLFSVKLASPFRIFSNYLDGAGVKMDDFIGYLKEAGDAAKFPIRATIQEYGSLEKALSSGKIDKSIVMDAIHRMTGEAESAHNALGKTTRTAEDYYDIVHKIWIEGAYGHTETRWKRLEEEGWDAMYVQQLVNDSVYSGYINLERLDDEHLRATGISKEHTEILKGLQKQAEETGIPIEDLVDDMLRPSGHELFFAGLYNIGKAVANIFTAIGNAYRRIFPTKSRDQLYQLIKGFYDFTDALANNEEVCKALESTFAGIFAVLDIIITFIKGVATAVLKGVGTVITELAGGVFEATGAFGEGLVAIRDWIKEHNILLDIITHVINAIAFIIVAIVKFVRYIASLPVVVNVFNKIKDAFGKIFNAIGGYFEKLGNWIADTVAYFESLDEITFDDVIGAMKDFYDNFVKVIGIGIKDAFVALWDSLPSIGDILLTGLNRFKEGALKAFSVFKDGTVEAAKDTSSIGSKILDVFKEIFSGLFGMVKGLITQVLPGLWDFVKQLGPVGTAITVFVGGILYEGLRLFHGIIRIVGDIHGILRETKQAIDQYGKLLRARRQESRSKVIINVAIAIAILAGSLFLLSKADPERLKSAGGALVAIALGISAMAIALGKLSDNTKNVKQFDKIFDFKNGIFGKRNYKAETQQISKILLSFAASILMIVVAIKIISDIETDDLIKAGVVVGIIATVLILFMYYGSQIEKTTNTEAYSIKLSGFLQLAIAIFIIASVFKMVSKLDLDGWALAQTLAIMFSFVLMLKVLLDASRDAGEHAGPALKSLLKASLAIFVLALIFKMVKSDADAKSLVAVGIMFSFVAMLGTLMYLAKDAGENAGPALRSLLKVSLAIAILALISILLSKMDFWAVAAGELLLVPLMAMVAGLIWVSKYGGEIKVRGIVEIAIAIGLLAAIAIVLSFLDFGAMWQGIAGVAVLTVCAGLLIAVSRLSSRVDVKGLLILMGAMFVMSMIFSFMSTIDYLKAIGTASAMALVITALAALLKGLKSERAMTKTNLVRTAITLGLLMAVVEILALIIWQLDSSVSDPVGAIIKAAAISTLLLTLAISFRILKGDNKAFAKGSIVQIAATLGAMVGVMEAIALILAEMEALGVKNGISNAAAIGGLLLAMAIAMRILPKSGVSLGAVGTIGLMMLEFLGFMEIAALILYQMETMDLQNGIRNMEIMGKMMELLVACMVALTPLVGLLGLLGAGTSFIGIAAVGALGLVLEGLFALGTLILDWASDQWVHIGENIKKFWESISGALHEIENDNLEPAIDTLVSLVAKMTEVGGSDFWGWLGDGIAGIFGGSTVEFAQEEFTAGMGSVKSAIGVLVEINDLLKENPIDSASIDASMTSLNAAITAATNLEEVGNVEDVTDFYATATAMVEGLTGFSDIVKANQDKIDPENAQKVADLCGILIALADGLPKSSQWNLLDGLVGRKQTLDEFANTLPPLAYGIVLFCQSIEGNADTVKKEYAEKAAAVAEILSNLGQNLPDSNAWNLLGFLKGRKQTLDEFAQTLPALATGIIVFCKEIQANESYVKSDYATKASDIGGILASLANNLPDKNGVLQDWFGGGKTELDDFGEQLKSFGSYMTEFCKNVEGISYTENDGGGVDSTIKIAQKLADVAVAVSDVEDAKMSSFYNFLKNVGQYTKTFDEQVKEIDAEQLLTNTQALVDMANTIGAVDNSAKFEQVANGFKTLGEMSIDGLSEAITDQSSEVITAIDDMITMVNNHITLQERPFTDAMKSAVSGIVKAIGDKKTSVKTAAISLTSEFISGLQDDTKINSIKSAGKALVTALENGIKLGMSPYTGTSASSPTMFKGALDHVDAGKTLIDNKKADFETVGKNLVLGLKAGIEHKTTQQSLMLTIDALGSAMDTRMRNATHEESPSKDTFKIGQYFVEGLTLGIQSLSGEAIKASENLGFDSVNAVSKTIANISAMVNDNIDTEPVIRPVLDLSNVQNGVKTIDSMFSANQAIRAGNGFNAGKEILVNGLVGSGGNSYNFTQNIYSPTALNRIDIYRQTKTQFSMALERMKHA